MTDFEDYERRIEFCDDFGMESASAVTDRAISAAEQAGMCISQTGYMDIEGNEHHVVMYQTDPVQVDNGSFNLILNKTEGSGHFSPSSLVPTKRTLIVISEEDPANVAKIGIDERLGAIDYTEGQIDFLGNDNPLASIKDWLRQIEDHFEGFASLARLQDQQIDPIYDGALGDTSEPISEESRGLFGKAAKASVGLGAIGAIEKVVGLDAASDATLRAAGFVGLCAVTVYGGKQILRKLS